MRRRLSRLCCIPLLILGGRAALAQDDGVTIALTVSPSIIDFGDFGGPFPAAVFYLSAGRHVTRFTGLEGSVFLLGALGGQTSTPGCVPGGLCEARTTPSALSGAVASLFLDVGRTGVRATIGGGVASAQGGEGFSRRSTTAGLLGFDWLSQSSRRISPTVSVRLMRLASPLAGARQVFLPGVGLRF